MRPESLQFLQTYLNTPAPVTQEVGGQKLWIDYVSPYVDQVFTDAYGSVAAVVNPDNDYKVVIEAHADEIAWFVHYIDDKGYIFVVRNGGSDHQIAPSMRVHIHGDKGTVNGVFGWPAIHVRQGKDKHPEVDNIYIDVGAENKQQVLDMGIDIGTIVTYQDGFMTMNDDKYIVCRALDNRIGGFVIAEVARTLKQQNIDVPFGLYIVNAVQEEIGLKGAQMMAHNIQPDCAIVIDVGHDTQSPMYDKKKQGDFAVGKGPIIDTSAAVHLKLRDKMIAVAKQNNIPYQRSASSRYNGTDTASFAYSNSGVPSALMSLPLKYMHTTVETVRTCDIQSCIDLFVGTLRVLEYGDDFSYF